MHSATNQMELEEAFMLDAVLKENVEVLLIIEPKQESGLYSMEKPSDKSLQMATVASRVIHSGLKRQDFTNSSSASHLLPTLRDHTILFLCI